MELHENTEKQESALLVAVDTGNYDVEASLAELYELTKTAGDVYKRQTVVRTQDNLVKLHKRGRMLVSSYEALRFQKLDLFTVTLRRCV